MNDTTTTWLIEWQDSDGWHPSYRATGERAARKAFDELSTEDPRKRKWRAVRVDVTVTEESW